MIEDTDDHGAPAAVRLMFDGIGAEHRFEVVIEPEGMVYRFPPEERLMLLFRGFNAMDFSVTHGTNEVVIWRPGDTEVWAVKADGSADQIGGFADIPAPWMDHEGRAAMPPIDGADEWQRHGK